MHVAWETDRIDNDHLIQLPDHFRTLQERWAGKTSRGCSVSVKEQLKHSELLCGVYERLGESLWVRIRQDASKGTQES